MGILHVNYQNNMFTMYKQHNLGNIPFPLHFIIIQLYDILKFYISYGQFI